MIAVAELEYTDEEPDPLVQCLAHVATQIEANEVVKAQGAYDPPWVINLYKYEVYHFTDGDNCPICGRNNLFAARHL